MALTKSRRRGPLTSFTNARLLNDNEGVATDARR